MINSEITFRLEPKEEIKVFLAIPAENNIVGEPQYVIKWNGKLHILNTYPGPEFTGIVENL